MKVIEFRVQYTGATEQQRGTFIDDGFYSVEYEVVTVEARDINSGFTKVLKIANEPLGNGVRREIGRVEFWRVV